MKQCIQIVALAVVGFTFSQVSTAQGARERTGDEKNSAGIKGASGSGDTVAVQHTQDIQNYRIGAQDVLRVDVWKEPDISRVVPVRPDGKITLPLLNDVQAGGLTPASLGDVIREGLKNYINDPQVTVTVTEINSQRVFVNGEVTKPGMYPLIPNMTVLQALTSSGGFTLFANTKKIYVLRVEDGKQIRIPVNYKLLVSGKKPEENILLRSGDTVVVP